MVDKDVIIAEQQEQIQQLTEQVIDLQKLVEKLRDKIARLEKNSFNSSKPPSSGIVDPQPREKSKRKRRIGGQKRHRKHSRRLFSPDEMDKTVVHKLPDEEIKRPGLVEFDETESALQQIDLPEKLFDVIDHRVQLYLAPNGEIVKAQLPKEIHKAGLFSPRMTALTGYLKGGGHMSYSTLRAFFKDVMGLELSLGFLSKVCPGKLSAALQRAYADVAEHIRKAAIVGSDETVHKNPTYKSAWTWCQQTLEAVFFHVSNLRGSKGAG